MKKQLIPSLFLAFLFASSCAQNVSDSLFDAREPLDIALTLSVKQVRKSRNDTTYLSHQLYYRNPSGNYDSIKVGIKGRGNSRLQLCYFPPLWIKIEKKHAKGTVFEGNKKIKLVVPCDAGKESNELILREYLCYKLYELVTPYTFKTRLVNMDVTELRGKRSSKHEQKGIFIEDLERAAKRFDAKPLGDASVSPALLHDTSALRFDLFQFMIANTDWSKGAQHNSKLIYQKPLMIPIPYDFDMSGLVDAHYAVVSQVNGESLPVESVRERYYRGHCRSKDLTEFVRDEFISKEEKFLALPDGLKGALPDNEIKGIKNYLEEFFTILKDDHLFEEKVVSNCREL